MKIIIACCFILFAGLVSPAFPGGLLDLESAMGSPAAVIRGGDIQAPAVPSPAVANPKQKGYGESGCLQSAAEKPVEPGEHVHFMYNAYGRHAEGMVLAVNADGTVDIGRNNGLLLYKRRVTEIGREVCQAKRIKKDDLVRFRLGYGHPELVGKVLGLFSDGIASIGVSGQVSRIYVDIDSLRF